MPVNINVPSLWNRLSGSRPEDYVKSDEFNALILGGLKQMSMGEDPTDLVKATTGLAGKGVDPEKAQKFVSGFVDHFNQATQRKNLDAVVKENAGSPAFMKTVTPDPRERDSMEAGGFDPNQHETLSRMMPATPEKQLSQNQAMRIMGPGKAWENPSSVGSFMQVPQHQELLRAQAADETEQASQRRTARRLEEIKANELEKMDTPAPDGEPSDRSLALFPSLANRLPQRDKAEDPLLEQRRKYLEAQALDAAAGARERDARAGYYRERDRSGRSGQDSETIADRVVKPADQMIAERAIAKTAEDRGVTKMAPELQAQALQKIADDFGFELTGSPQLKGSSSLIPGTSIGATPASIGGDFSLRPKQTTRTVTRGGGQARPKPGPAASGNAPAMIRVREKSSGRTGSLPADEFDPKLYERIQ